jgi:uncharacterized protein (TIGR02996 family)
MDPKEQAFFDALDKDPNDDIARLVWADQLQELGDPRGEYLRLEVQVHTATRRMEELRQQLDPRWLRSVARTWAIKIFSFPRERIIETIKVIREATNCGLKDAKDVVNRITATGQPQVAIDGLDEAQVERALRTIRSSGAVAERAPTARGG